MELTKLDANDKANNRARKSETIDNLVRIDNITKSEYRKR